MAWAEQLPSGRYRGLYRDRAGRRRPLADTYTQPAEAKREAARKEDEARRRPEWRKHAGKLTWGQWADEWWPARKVEPATRKADEHRMSGYLRPHWGEEPLARISRDDVQDWVDELVARRKTVPAAKGAKGAEARDGKQWRKTSEATLSASSVTKLYRLFSVSMKAAVKAGRLDATPCIGIELPVPEPADEHFLTRAEFDQLLAAAPDETTVMVLRLAVGTGLRWSELVGLHRARVDIAQRRIVVQEVYEQASDSIKPYPKNTKRRGVPITDELAAQLQEWMDAHPAVRCATPHRDGKRCRSALVIPSGDGTVLDYSHFRRDRFDPAVAASGLEEVTPHDMRHTYASWLVQSGVKIEVLQALLGHASITTTQRYAHLADTQWEQVRGVLDTKSGTAVPEKVAPHLPHEEDHEEGGKIVHLAERRRSAT